MTKKQQISGSQLLWLLLAGRLSNCLLLPADSLHALSVPDLVATTALNALVLLLLMIPTALALRHTQKSILSSRVTAVIYAGLMLFVVYLDLLQFADFARQTVHSELSVPWMTVALIVTGITASLYGIQALGRTATVVAVIGVGLLLLFCVLLIPHMRSVNMPPAVFSGFGAVWRQTLKELPRTAEIVAVGALYPYVNGKPFRIYGGFIGASGLLTLLVCIVTTAVLGDYAGMTAYPFYAAVSVADVGVLGSAELPVVVLWLGTFFIRIALFGWLWLEQAQTIFGERAKLMAAGIAAAVWIAVTFWLQRRMFSAQWAVVTLLYGAALLTVTLIFPMVRRRHA